MTEHETTNTTDDWEPDVYELLADESGAVFVEYITLTITVSLIGAIAVAGLGLPLLRLFLTLEAFILFPAP